MPLSPEEIVDELVKLWDEAFQEIGAIEGALDMVEVPLPVDTVQQALADAGHALQQLGTAVQREQQKLDAWDPAPSEVTTK